MLLEISPGQMIETDSNDREQLLVLGWVLKNNGGGVTSSFAISSGIITGRTQAAMSQ
jgi:hypothetical protein